MLNQITRPSGKLGSDGFVTVSADDKLGFINLNMTSPLEELSLKFIEVWKTIIIERYLEYTMFTPKGSYVNLKSTTDSLSQNFKKKYYRHQDLKSKYLALMKKEEQLEKGQEHLSQGTEIRALEKKINALDVDVEIAKADYLATLEKLKEAQKDLTDQMPLIKVTDQSISPIKSYKPSAIVAAIKGGIMGAILSIVIILALRVYRNIVNEAKQLEKSLDA